MGGILGFILDKIIDVAIQFGIPYAVNWAFNLVIKVFGISINVGDFLKKFFPNLAQSLADFLEHLIHPTVVKAGNIKAQAKAELKENIRGCFGMSCSGTKGLE